MIQALQVFLAFSLLIVFHEFGHFLFAKLFHIRVDKFFMFFDAGGVRLFSTKSQWFLRIFPKAAEWETEFGIGWLPFGGYCKIAGMIDESMDVESVKGEPKPWEYRTHPAWQRLLVLSGGVLFNFIGAVAIFTGILSREGEAYVSNRDTAIYVNELSYDLGFRTGDRILMYDDYAPADFNMLQADLARRKVHKAVVLRGEDTLDLYIDRSRIGEVLQVPGMFDVALPFIVDSIPESSPNYSLGLSRGDRIVSVGGVPVTYVQDSRPLLARHSGSTVELGVARGADSLSVTASVDSTGRIGVYMQTPSVERRTYKGFAAIPAGIRYTYTQIRDYIRDLGLVVTPSTGAYKSVGSFISIGQAFPSLWNWSYFMYMLALLGVMLGVVNLVPIPGLDGGHILFTLYEMTTGRKPGDKFLMVVQMVGMVIVMLLMFLACGNDIIRIIK